MLLREKLWRFVQPTADATTSHDLSTNGGQSWTTTIATNMTTRTSQATVGALLPPSNQSDKGIGNHLSH